MYRNTRTAFALIALAASLAPLPAQQPVEPATEARVWLKVPAGQAPLPTVDVSSGEVESALWEPDLEARSRQTDIRFSIHWWKWTTQTIRFTPTQSGTVELWLHGPWAAEKEGLTPRREVLWDGLTAEGADLANGGFEERESAGPAGWKSPWAAWPATQEWPLAGTEAAEGAHVAATWSKRPVMQVLQLTAGKPVTLRLQARAATPPGFIPPKRLGTDTPAHRALSRFKRGVNLGNGWEAEPGTWGQKIDVQDIDRIAAEGFDHIRVPVAWHFHVKEEHGRFTIDPAFLAELEPVLRRAIERNCRVMLNWHHFHDLTRDPAAHLARFTGVWHAIASHFQGWPPELCFELLNEPCDALDTATCNKVYRTTIDRIRSTHPDRLIVVSPGHWGIIPELEHLHLPDDDPNLAVTVHCYEPFHFTHQGAGWVGLQDLRNVVYPGPPREPIVLPASLRRNHAALAFIEDYNTQPPAKNPSSPRKLRELLDMARDWSAHFGRPVHLGEFGSHQTADIASRERYLRDVRTLAEQRGIPWTLWEWKAGFGYWDPQQQRARFRHCLME